MGLAISKRLVELMGGSIMVESQLGAGSTFSFHVVLQPAGEQGSGDGPCGPISMEDPIMGRLTILVAEDNLVNRKVTTTLLERKGCRVKIATTGKEAVEQARNGCFDLMLMDVHMPEMDGLEATRLIRAMELGRRTPIIALTAGAMSGDEEECRKAGMDGYLSKPFRAAALYAIIAENVRAANGDEVTANR